MVRCEITAKFQSETLKRREHFRDIGLDDRIMCILKIGCEGVGWILLAQERV
jgi:hypothetical protein